MVVPNAAQTESRGQRRLHNRGHGPEGTRWAHEGDSLQGIADGQVVQVQVGRWQWQAAQADKKSQGDVYYNSVRVNAGPSVKVVIEGGSTSECRAPDDEPEDVGISILRILCYLKGQVQAAARVVRGNRVGDRHSPRMHGSAIDPSGLDAIYAFGQVFCRTKADLSE